MMAENQQEYERSNWKGLKAERTGIEESKKEEQTTAIIDANKEKVQGSLGPNCVGWITPRLSRTRGV